MANIPLSVGCRSALFTSELISLAKGCGHERFIPTTEKKKKSRLHSNKIKPNKHFVHFNKDEQKG